MSQVTQEKMREVRRTIVDAHMLLTRAKNWSEDAGDKNLAKRIGQLQAQTDEMVGEITSRLKPTNG
jgi:hypothetical protein